MNKKNKLAAALGADIVEPTSTLPEVSNEEKEAEGINETMVEVDGDTIAADSPNEEENTAEPATVQQEEIVQSSQYYPLELEDGNLEVIHKSSNQKMIVSKQHFEEYRHNFL